MTDITQTFTRDPNFGRDPWKGSSAPLHTAPTPVYTGADALTGDIVLLPPDLNVYMSYVDNYRGWDQLVARFGNTTAYLVSITIFGNRARCADVESGAMNAADLPHWLDNVAIKDDGYLPWVYTSAGNASLVNEYIGDRKVIRWFAHTGQGAHVCGPNTCGYPQADWTQWIFSGAQGQNIDRSIGYVLPKKIVPDPNHYAWYMETSGVHERAVVEAYDNLRDTSRAKIFLHRSRLKRLREDCGHLAGRITTVMEEQKDPVLDNQFHRKWRRDMLLLREKGSRVGK